MDYAMRMVYETEGQRGGDIRGWHGEEAQREAEMEEMRAYEEEMERQRQWAKEAAEQFVSDYNTKCADIWREGFNNTFREVMAEVLRPVPPAWRGKPRTYGAYKRMMIRRIGKMRIDLRRGAINRIMGERDDLPKDS